MAVIEVMVVGATGHAVNVEIDGKSFWFRWPLICNAVQVERVCNKVSRTEKAHKARLDVPLDVLRRTLGGEYVYPDSRQLEANFNFKAHLEGTEG
jgi:hypothetical protein